MPTSNEALIRQWFEEVWNNGRSEALEEMLAADLRFGREGAKVNFRLAHELHKGDLPLSCACWLLGAHSLAAREHEMASTHFVAAARYAQTAGVTKEALPVEGYQYLASCLEASDTTRQSDFSAILSRLESTSEGAEFAEQLKTAWKVFISSMAEGSSRSALTQS